MIQDLINKHQNNNGMHQILNVDMTLPIGSQFSYVHKLLPIENGFCHNMQNFFSKILYADSLFFNPKQLTFSPLLFLCPKMLSAFYVSCIYSSALKARFYHGSKHYEQWEQSGLGPYCLQYRQPKNISR